MPNFEWLHLLSFWRGYCVVPHMAEKQEGREAWAEREKEDWFAQIVNHFFIQLKQRAHTHMNPLVKALPERPTNGCKALLRPHLLTLLCWGAEPQHGLCWGLRGYLRIHNVHLLLSAQAFCNFQLLWCWASHPVAPIFALGSLLRLHSSWPHQCIAKTAACCHHQILVTRRRDNVPSTKKTLSKYCCFISLPVKFGYDINNFYPILFPAFIIRLNHNESVKPYETFTHSIVQQQ